MSIFWRSQRRHRELLEAIAGVERRTAESLNRAVAEIMRAMSPLCETHGHEIEALSDRMQQLEDRVATLERSECAGHSVTSVVNQQRGNPA